ncbi:hypothetical protein OIU84_006204 [Salix udensis]|uniref:Uncharacterized protein n=1 Tax=Salix udensis TaxID=889485 RepID=A0AAD6JY25_9ROSI|nr:hypothetical protein OIU84_006204 [Salix udensis]
MICNIGRPVQVKLKPVHNIGAVEGQQRWFYIALHKHEITGASHHRKIKNLDVVSSPEHGDGSLVVLQLQSDLLGNNIDEPIKAGCYGNTFCHPYNF